MGFSDLSKETAQQKGAFLREATGLVREMNAFDVLAMNSFNISAGLGLAFVLYTATSVFYSAGTNGIVVGVILATFGGLSGALMFGFLTAMVPRSVADYTIVTRAVHPALGFATNWTWAFWNVAWAGILTSFVSNWALYDLLSIYGTMYKVPWAYNLAYSTSSSFWTLFPQSSGLNLLIGTVIIAAFAIMLSVGPRAFLYFQRAVFVFGVFSLIVVLGVMAMTTHATFVTNWDGYYANWGTNAPPAGSDAYAWVTSFAGPVSIKAYAPFLALLGVIPVASWSLAYGQMTTAVGGEVKRPSRSLPLGAGLSVLIAGGIMAIGTFLFLRVVGLNFISGAVNSYYGTLAGVTSGPWYGMYPAPYFDFFTSIIAQSPIVTLIVGIGFICWIIYYPGLDCLANTRALLAWSFDRVAPAYFGKVSDRFHTPIRAVMLYSILDWIAFYIFSTHYNLVGSLTATLAVFLTMFLAMGVVGLVFPYLSTTKPIYQQSGLTQKIGPVPVLSIVAAGWLLFLGVGAFFYLTEGALFTNTPLMLGLSATAFLSAFPLYYLAKYVRSRQGIDLSLAYKVIPPE